MSPRSRDDINRDNARRSGQVVCSFCNKPDTVVRKMIAGPNGLAICDECVDVCNDILSDAVVTRTSTPGAPTHETEMLSFKCPECGKKLGIDTTSLPPPKPDSH